MKIQIYSYLHPAYSSIPIVTSNWVRELAKAGHDVKVHDYIGINCRFPSVEPFLGKHEPMCDTGIFFGHPSLQKNTNTPIFAHKLKIGVLVAETAIKQEEASILRKGKLSSLVVPSHWVKRAYSNMSHLDNRIQVVHHGVADRFFDNVKVEKRPKFTFLYVFQQSPTGGTCIRKNLENLIEGFELLKKKTGRDLELIVKSTTEIEADTATLEKKHGGLKFELRYMTIDELSSLYRSCHAYVNPTCAEGFGITPLEAMACRLPVVSTIHTGLAEYLNTSNCVQIAHGKQNVPYSYAMNHGTIFDVSPASIKDGMLKLLENYEVVCSKTEAIAQDVRNRFSWQNVMKGFLAWLSQ